MIHQNVMRFSLLDRRHHGVAVRAFCCGCQPDVRDPQRGGSDLSPSAPKGGIAYETDSHQLSVSGRPTHREEIFRRRPGRLAADRLGDLPNGVRELALICDDPDAPTPEPWVHWVIYKIPAGSTGLAGRDSAELRLASPAGAVQGKNSWPVGETIGYRGPMPPPGHGVHHYHFSVYALDVELSVEPGLGQEDAIEGRARSRPGGRTPYGNVSAMKRGGGGVRGVG